MTRLANEHGAVNLAQGFPDFDGPDFVKEAAIEAIRAGRGQYARMSGIPEIHAALAAKYRRDYGLEYAAGHGGHRDLRRDRGDLRGDPGHVRARATRSFSSSRTTTPTAERARWRARVPRFVTLRAPDWRLRSATELAARSRRGRGRSSSTRRTTRPARSSPREELEFLAALCRERDLLCITDEVYEHLVYDGPARPDGDAARDARADDHDLALRQDVLPDRLEDRLGGGAARS